MALTPVKNCFCAQDDFEPVIRRHAETAGPGELRFNTEMTSLQAKGGWRYRHFDEIARPAPKRRSPRAI